MALERLQKILAASGVASRRKSEELITTGRVSVNGQVVTELGSKADASIDKIFVDGKSLEREQFLYFLLHKPKGYVTTASDPQGRPTVLDLMRNIPERIYPVGRLDYASEGLLLMTNDGALAQKLTKAGEHIPKTYLVKISGKLTERSLVRLRAGITIPLDDGRRVKTSPAKIRLAEDAPNPWYEVILIEGRNRQIRRMFDAIGHHVEKIKRTKLGPLTLDVLPGKFRPLTPKEISELKAF
jgi:23S rRNA pseudouridine2605 synthase